jgi:hypothetical protein
MQLGDMEERVCQDLTLLLTCSLDRPNVGRRAPRRPKRTYMVSGHLLRDKGDGQLMKDEVSLLLPMMPAGKFIQ